MEDYAFTRAKITADRKAIQMKAAKCAAVTVAAGAFGWMLNGEDAATLLAGVAAMVSALLF